MPPVPCLPAGTGAPSRVGALPVRGALRTHSPAGPAALGAELPLQPRDLPRDATARKLAGNDSLSFPARSFIYFFYCLCYIKFAYFISLLIDWLFHCVTRVASLGGLEETVAGVRGESSERPKLWVRQTHCVFSNKI